MGTLNKVLREYTDTVGVHHLVVSTGDKTGDIVEYTSVKTVLSVGENLRKI